MKKLITSSLILCFCAICPFLAIGCGENDSASAVAFSMTQVSDKAEISLNWDKNKNISEMEVLVTRGDKEISKTTIKDTEVLNSGTTKVDGIYGKNSVQVKAKMGKIVATTTTEVALSASEYNIATLVATMPVTLFSLSIWDINENPTLVYLERDKAYNWDNLPENVYSMPIIRDNIVSNVYSDTGKYVKELYSINPKAKFHFYINDLWNELYFSAVIANKIPDAQHDVVFLSDGTASYTAFNNTYGGANAQEKYDALRTKVLAYRDEVATLGRINPDSPNRVANDWDACHTYVLTHELNNVSWWLPRVNGVIDSADTDFLNQAKSDIIVKSIGGMLNALTAEQKTELKALYNFNGEMFAKAETENKKVMMFLGSNVNVEQNFNEYAKFMMTYYGDEEYVYYYKGHPATPTPLHPVKQQQLETLGIIDVDSNIAAELILCFYPGLYMCGYNSSTYQSVESEEMACAMFGWTKDAAYAEVSMSAYVDKLESFVFVINASNPTYGSYVVGEDTYLVAEFNDTTNYDFAVFNATTQELKFYKDNAEVAR